MTPFIPLPNARRFWKGRAPRLLSGLGMVALVTLPATGWSQVVPLGTAQNFGVLAGQTVTNTGPTSVTGDVGTSPGTAITGFPPGATSGTIRANDATAGTAQTDLTAAYNAAVGFACTADLSNQNLGGLTLTPGVYCFNSAAQLTGDLTLDFQGNANAAFLFKIGSALTTATGSTVRAINSGGAVCTPNVNFQVGSSATLGSGSSFAGNLLSFTSITLVSGANLRGRALARNGAVTLDSNLNVGGCPFAVTTVGGGGGGGVVVPGATTAVPTLGEWNLIMLGLLVAAFGAFYGRRFSRRS